MVKPIKSACYLRWNPAYIAYSRLSPIQREREDEIATIKGLEIPFTYIPLTPLRGPGQEHLKIVEEYKPHGMPGYFPREITSLEGHAVFPRSFIGFTRLVLEAIVKIGGQPIVSLNEFNRQQRWPELVSEEYLKREMAITTVEHLPEMAPQYASDGAVFVKLLEKSIRLNHLPNHGAVAQLEAVVSAEQKGIPFQRKPGAGLGTFEKDDFIAVSPQDEVILSNPLHLQLDDSKSGTLEYRFWVFDGEVIAYSRYGGPSEGFIPDAVHLFAHKFIESHKNRIGPHYVLDVGQTTDRGEAVIEINDVMEAGGTSKNITTWLFEAFLRMKG
ncbi:ATP-grasp domain-containing protein [Candidatus Woesearchaeota archaeon]|nr:ATP-grasp domain-containing protein [Candidatus Woesearchaeota archaeon]